MKNTLSKFPSPGKFPGMGKFPLTGKFTALDRLALPLIFLLSFWAVKSLLVPGFYGASDDLHIAWLHQMDKVIRESQFPPRFIPDLSFGFGYPLFNFVFPLPFYFAEIFHLLGSSLVDSIKIVFLLSIPVSGYFMYKLTREYATSALAIAAGVLYMYTPYRATDIYIRGAIGEIVAFVFLPLIILAIKKLTEEVVRKKWIGILALSTAALVLSHNIMSYMFFPFAVCFAILSLLVVPRKFFWKRAISILVGLGLGILASSYFWLPAIVESGLLKYDTVFNFVDHFPTLRQLVTPYFGYGASVPGPYDGMSFFVGSFNILLSVFTFFGILIFRKRMSSSKRTILVWGLLVLFASILMMNHRSVPLWENIPLIPYFQFPWRFLSLVTFVTPLFIVIISDFKGKNVVAFAIIFLVIVLNAGYFRPQDFLGRKDEYFLNRYVPDPTATDAYKQTGEEYLRLPKISEGRPDKEYPLVETQGAAIENLERRGSLGARFEVTTSENLGINYNKYYFPGWKVLIDGKEVAVEAAKPFGQVRFNIPPGRHKIEVMFKESNMRMVLNLVSLLSILVAATIILMPDKIGKNVEKI